MNDHLQTSKEGLEFITKWEGCVLKPYKDIAGLRTIGVGHLIKTGENFPVGVEISREKALEILAADVKLCEDAIKKKTRVLENKEFWEGKVCTEILYVTEPNQDFATVCHYADFDHNLIRRKVKETFRKMEESNGKGNMPKVPWKRLYEVNGLRRERPASDRDRAAV